jgi:hypothetical protein
MFKNIDGTLYILPFTVKGKSVYDAAGARIMTCITREMAVYFKNTLNTAPEL